jgi:hypothetical protein
MSQLPEDIKIEFFNFRDDRSALDRFEQWIYATDILEEILGAEDYLNLISLDFTNRSTRHDLIKIIDRYIHLGEYQRWKLSELLHRFISLDGDLRSSLWEFYELYCDGFYFLDVLGLEYGLTLIDYGEENWQNSTIEQRERLLANLLPGALREAQKVIDWLDTGKIVITDIQDEWNQHSYIDNRTEDERNPSVRVIGDGY